MDREPLPLDAALAHTWTPDDWAAWLRGRPLRLLTPEERAAEAVIHATRYPDDPTPFVAELILPDGTRITFAATVLEALTRV